MDLKDHSLPEFTSLLASSAPIPGGGGASAAIGALGASLCSMAASLTVGKQKYTAVEQDMKLILAKTDSLRVRLLQLIDKDAEAFYPLSVAYAIPKDDPQRNQKLYQASLAACEVPLEILDCCCDVIELLETALEKCSKLMLSDVGCGATACKAALESAAMNVYVNIRLFPDDKEANVLKSRTNAILAEYLPRATDITDAVMAYLGAGTKRARLLPGAKVANSLLEDGLKRIEALNKKGVLPTLAIVRVGDDPGAIAYERNTVKRCQKIGISIIQYIFEEDAEAEQVLNAIRKINEDPAIHGCLLFRPLPKHLNEREICDALRPEKDVDCVTTGSLDGIFTGEQTGFPPCTAQACIELLKHYGFKLTGKKICVIGRSLVIGRPVSMLLQRENATVTMCHSKTEDMASICAEAEILVVAAGKAKIVDETYTNPNQIIVDVGINTDENGKICGDVDYNRVSTKVKAITPVPGGVGSVTTMILCLHVIEAAERLSGK